MLLVNINAEFDSLTIAALHLPHKGMISEDWAQCMQWWNDAHDVLNRHYIDFLLIDENGRLGSSTSPSVGLGGFQQREDLPGSLLHEILLDLKMCIPSTFTDCDQTDYTCTHCNGTHHRKNSVALPIH